ncbi:MAG: hypothetical protein ACO1N0_16175 [Fluviicola sp.]
MTYTFSLDKNDYLTHQLFLASVTLHAKEQIKNSRIIWTVTYLMLSFCFYSEKKPLLSIFFLIAAIAWVIFYPAYAKKRHQKHFEKHVNTMFQDKFDDNCSISIEDQLIHSKDEHYEMKVSLAEVKHIYETSDYFYALLKSGLTFIFPRQKIENVNALEDQLRDIAAKNQISFTEMTDWKW